jgi:hypothetical protein
MKSVFTFLRLFSFLVSKAESVFIAELEGNFTTAAKVDQKLGFARDFII